MAPRKKAAAKKPKAPTRIQKSGNGHRYFLDDKPVKGVTTIIGDGVPKPAMEGWAAKMTAEFVVNNLRQSDDGKIVADELIAALRDVNADRKHPEKWAPSEKLPIVTIAKVLAQVRYAVRDEAGKRGSDVHSFGERLAQGEKVTPPDELADHVRHYVDFLNTWEPTGALLERVVINRRWRYMGKLDMIADFPGKVWASGPWRGRPVGRGLVDIKTARSGIFPEVALQLQGYRFAETMLDGAEEVPMPAVDWIGAIHVRADGYDVYPFDVTGDRDTDPAYLAFLYAKQVGDFFDREDGPASTIKLDSATVEATS